MQNLRGRREKRNFSLRMSAAAGPVEPERNFLFARTPEIPGGARPRRCADNTNAAVARSHRLCPFASCSLARAVRHPSHPAAATAVPPAPTAPAATPRRSPCRSASPVAQLLTAGPPRTAAPRAPRARGPSRPPRRAPRVADVPRPTAPSAPISPGSDAGRRVAGSRPRTKPCRPRALSLAPPTPPASPSRATAHPRSLSLPLSTAAARLTLRARSHFPLRRRTRASPYPPARSLVPTPPVALFVVKLFMLYILKGTYQPPFR